ncbi:MAG TPA: cell division protein ZipA C-terminal FtsZ-binding domain-containing protein [Acidiferrobacterales bacterium]
MELQYALLLIGVFIVAGVALSAYDSFRFDWRRRARTLIKKKTASPAAGGDTPAESAAPTVRQEPVISSGIDFNPGPPNATQRKHLKSDAAVAIVDSRSDDYYLSEELQSIENAALMPLNLSLNLQDPEEDMKLHPSARRPMPDDRIDFIVNLPGKGPVSRDRALGVYKQNEYMLEKPHQIYGLGYKSGLWSNIQADPEYAQYSDFAVAVQLADTRGAVTETELNTFVQLSLKLADALKRPTKLSLTIEQALERAHELDAFCETNDVLASVTIAARNPTGFSGRAINQAATQLGMQFGAMNIYHMKNDNPLGCRHLFSLANLYDPGEFKPEAMSTLKTKGLTLFMSVPCAYQPVKVFEKMVETGRGLCGILGGTLQDQDGKPLTDEGIKVIRTQIEAIAADMQNRGIIPGGDTAMRLF